MERWQQQLQEILNEKKVVEEEVGSVSDCPFEWGPGYTFVVGPGAAIDVTPLELRILSPGHLQGAPEQGTGTCLLVDAHCLPAGAECVTGEGEWIEDGIWIESCEPYVVRAINRCCALWYIPAGARGVLAVLPGHKTLDLYDLLVYEYAHRYCSARSRGRPTRLSDNGTSVLGRATPTARHMCGALVLRQRLYKGRLRRKRSSFALAVEERSLVFCTPGGSPITHCPVCEMGLSEANTRGVDRKGRSAHE